MIVSALALLTSALAASAYKKSGRAECTRSYTVKEGDYCDAISAAHNSSTYQLSVCNFPAVNDACTNLEVNQTLCLGYTGQDCQTTYIVQEGDYCNLISGKFGINSTLLMTNNPQIDDNCWNLYSGQVLCVASEVLFTPPLEGFVMPGSSLEYDDGGDDDDDASSSDEGAGSTDTGSSGSNDAQTQSTSAPATTSISPTTTSSSSSTSPAPTDDSTVAAATGDDDDEGDDDGDNDDLPDCED